MAHIAIVAPQTTARGYSIMAHYASPACGRQASKTAYMIYVYVLESLRDQSTYVGMTNDLSRRLAEHNNGKNRSTKAKAPFKLLFSENYPNYKLGRQREKWLKSGIGREYIKKFAGIV